MRGSPPDGLVTFEDHAFLATSIVIKPNRTIDLIVTDALRHQLVAKRYVLSSTLSGRFPSKPFVLTPETFLINSSASKYYFSSSNFPEARGHPHRKLSSVIHFMHHISALPSIAWIRMHAFEWRLFEDKRIIKGIHCITSSWRSEHGHHSRASVHIWQPCILKQGHKKALHRACILS